MEIKSTSPEESPMKLNFVKSRTKNRTKKSYISLFSFFLFLTL